MIVFNTVINGSAAGALNEFVLCNLQNSLRRTTGWILAIHIYVLKGNGAKTPDETYLKVCGGLASSATTLNIETAAVPRAMVMALLTVLCLPTRAVGHVPLWQQIPRCDRERPGQPEHNPAAGQNPRNLFSHLPYHGRLDTIALIDSLRSSAEQLERLGHPKDVADLLLQVAVEVSVNGNLCNEIERGEVHHIEHDPR